MKKRKSSISIIIPAWNSESQLKKNLPHVLAAAAKISARVIVIDDNSTKDMTYEYLLSQGSRITLLHNEITLGFARTVNRGVESSTTDLIILLNTDVRPSLNCFVGIHERFERDTFALSLNSDGSFAGGMWSRGLFHHYRITISKDFKPPYASLYASGGQGVFDRQKWLALGGMDPMYAPFYWEDVDLGYRAWKRGWKIYWLPDKKVIHDHDSSTISSSFSRTFINQTALRNQFIFTWKNITDFRLFISHHLYLLFYLLKYPRAVLSATTRLPAIIISKFRESPKSKRTDQEILSIWEN